MPRAPRGSIRSRRIHAFDDEACRRRHGGGTCDHGVRDRADGVRARAARSRKSRSIARRCRTATRPSCGKSAARTCGSSRAGPKKVSLEQCDLGQGPGVVKGAYAKLPRYFADADRVMDLETRLVHCMVTLQGITPAEATKQPFGNGPAKSDIEALVAYVTSESRGMKMDVPVSHPKEQETYALGEKMFFYRGGPLRFLLRHLPRRGRQAHPPAGPAQPHQATEARSVRTPPGPRTACRRASCAPSSGASTTASASSASPTSSSRPTRRSR